MTTTPTGSRAVKALAAAAVVGFALAGCGQSGSSTGSSSSSGDSSAGGDTIASTMIMGGPPELKQRADGLPGFEKNYGVVFGKYTTTDTGGPVTVNALKQGKIDVADIFTTDPAIKENNFVVLEDPKHNYAAQNVFPVINKEKATDGVKKTLDAVSAKLTTEALIDMNEKMSVDKTAAETVAKDWLKSNSLDAAGTDAKGASLKVGSANFPENVALAEIYAQALQAQGATVTKTLNIGSREKYYPALEQGSIDLMPEYNGTLLQHIDKNATASSPEDVQAALEKALPANLTALSMSKAQDSDALVVTKATADKYNLKSIADLAKPAK